MPDEHAASTAVTDKPEPSPGASEDALIKKLEDESRAEQPAEEPSEAPEAPAEEKPSEEVEEPEADLEARPELPEDAFHKYREAGIFKQFPELRGVIGRHEAYSELGPISELRELRTRFPGAEDVERIVQQAEEYNQLTETLRTNPTEFLARWEQEAPESWQQVVAQLQQIVYNANPQIYQEHALGQIQHTLGVLRRHYEQGGRSDLVDVLDTTIAPDLGIRLGSVVRTEPAADSPLRAELERLRKEKEERNAQDRRARHENFTASVEEEFAEQVLAELKTGIEKAFTPKGEDKPSVSEATLKRMLTEAWEAVRGQLRAQPQTSQYAKSILAKVARGDRIGDQDQKALVDFLVKRAKMITPGVVKQTVSEWSKNILSATQKAAEKRQAIAEKTKEPSGAGGGVPQRTASQGNPKRPLARDEQILQNLEQGQYVPQR